MKPNYIFILSMLFLILLCMFFNVYVYREGARTREKFSKVAKTREGTKDKKKKKPQNKDKDE